MFIEDADAEVLKCVAARLFEEGRRVFREAHLKGMDSFHAPTLAEQLEGLDSAIKEEQRAIVMQAEAVELHRQAINARTKVLARLKFANGW
ncbi:MAG: hypothetical protein LC746_13640 [Acidobacteria bacterium]|nr:hypothetical protein [Acidobacteriota bacterium]